mmetsp:Transcript_22908/g.46316  ORF Transcript_22908/g.46316 Transcript_22908/m.46316 type:complete len:102 (+) Transcript_22908:95-400(+)
MNQLRNGNPPNDQLEAYLSSLQSYVFVDIHLVMNTSGAWLLHMSFGWNIHLKMIQSASLYIWKIHLRNFLNDRTIFPETTRSMKQVQLSQASTFYLFRSAH